MILEFSFSDRFDKFWKNFYRKDKSHALIDLDGIGENIDIVEFTKKFFSKKQAVADVSVDSNANVSKNTILHYQNELVKPTLRLWVYYEIWNYANQLYNEDIAKEILTKQLTKEIYINDCHNFLKPYCWNFSSMNIICQGLPFCPSKSKPPKNIISFSEHTLSFISHASNQLAGATGMADWLICYGWYVEKLLKEHGQDNKLARWIINQQIQGFIYAVNQLLKGSLESPFCNISIYDDGFLTKLCDEYIFPDGKKVNKETVKWLQEMYLDEYNKALENTLITFPVNSICFSIDKDRNVLDEDFLDMVVKKSIKYMPSSFFAGETSVLSSCCRLKSDRNKEFFNTSGAGSSQIGSVGVVTLNLPRLAYLSKTKEEYIERLKINVELVSQINHLKRYLLQKNIDKGMLPLYNLGFMNLKHQYSTCGINGLYESIEIMGFDILKEDGQNFVKEILQTINAVNNMQEKKYNTPHNCEQTPSEGSACKLADADKLLGYNTKYEIYSNQFIPLIHEADMYDRIKVQGIFDKYMSGGSVLHLHFQDRITDKEYLKKLIKHIIKQGTVYHAINYNIQQCKNGHMIVGKLNKCSICGEKNCCKLYTSCWLFN